MSVPVARRIVVGVDFSAESAAALRWACREASLRGAQVHAVHVREEQCHSMASYAVPAQAQADDVDDDVMWRSVMPDPVPGVELHTESVAGLAARVLLGRSEGADMLVLGTACDTPGPVRSAGPVIRACLRRALCPVVVISDVQEPLERDEALASGTEAQVPVMLPVGAVGTEVRVPASSGAGLPGAPGGQGAPAKGVPVPAGA
jgi:nucleotide-binding universal stress UspA family protein